MERKQDPGPDSPEVAAAMKALDDFMAALNAHDEAGINAAFNFPHVRFASNRVAIFEKRGDYTFAGFQERTSTEGWHHSAWDFREPISAGPDKVHLDVQFSRWREDGSLIGRHRSLYIVTKLDGHWGIQSRSSFAP